METLSTLNDVISQGYMHSPIINGQATTRHNSASSTDMNISVQKNSLQDNIGKDQYQDTCNELSCKWYYYYDYDNEG